jgi:hypothetical protein
MLITFSEYAPNTNKVKGYNGVTSFASGYGSVRLFCQLPDGKTETIILQEVVHSSWSFNLISQSQIMHKDVKVEPVNHYGLNPATILDGKYSSSSLPKSYGSYDD